MAAKKKAAAPVRPPSQVWLVVDKFGSVTSYRTRREAKADGLSVSDGEHIVGPYVLAERVRQR